MRMRAGKRSACLGGGAQNSGMALPLLHGPPGRGFLPFRFFGNTFGRSCLLFLPLLFLPGLGVGHGGFQAIEHVPYAIEEILHDEG